MKSDDDDISTASNSEHTQSSEADGSESGSGSEVENESDPWEPLIEEAKERNVSEYEEIQQNFTERRLDEESASSQAYALILPKLQKDLERIYLERLFWMRHLRKDRVHRKVMNTRDAFINSDDFDHDEALEAAHAWHFSRENDHLPFIMTRGSLLESIASVLYTASGIAH